MKLRFGVVAGAGFIVGACALFTNLDGLGPTGDAAADANPSDASHEAEAGVVSIAQVGAVSDDTGDVQQTHLVWAKTSQRWVLFYFRDDAPMQVLTSISPDFIAWQPGAPLPLPYTNAGSGRELSVSYRAIGESDVVHVAVSHEISTSERRHTHARALVAGDAISFGAAEDVSLTTTNPPTNVNPDAPAALVTAAGTVYDATGFTGFGDGGSAFNANVFVANGKDDGGATFTSGGWARIDLELTPRHVNSRAFIEAAGSVAALWDNADVKPNPTNVNASVFLGSWSAPAPIFADAGSGQNENAWSVVVVSALQVHAVRKTASGALQHMLGGGTWTSGAPIPPITASPSGNVLLLTDAVDPTLFVLGVDNSIQSSKYSSGAWSAWRVVVPASAFPRAYLSGYAGDGNAAVIWTQVGSTGGYEIDGTPVRL